MGLAALDADRQRYQQAHQNIKQQYPNQLLSSYLKLLNYMQHHAKVLSSKAQTNQTMLLAPNIDVCGVNSYMQAASRSIGDDAELVSLYAAIFAQAELFAQNPKYTAAKNRTVNPEQLAKPLPKVPGLYSANTLQVFKHYPGYDNAGNTHKAPHQKPNLSAQDMRNKHLAPFRAAILAGARAVMSNWVAYPALEPSKQTIPAAYSKELLINTLRKQYGFNGLIVTDALNMGPAMLYILDKYRIKAPGLRDRMKYSHFTDTSLYRKTFIQVAGRMYEQCLLAGNDMMFYFVHPADRNKVFSAIVSRVKAHKSKLLPLVKQSVTRVLTAKLDMYPVIMQQNLGGKTMSEYIGGLAKPSALSTLVAQTLIWDYYSNGYERQFIEKNQIGGVRNYKKHEREALLKQCEQHKRIPPFFAKDKLTIADYGDATSDKKNFSDVDEGDVQDLGLETIADIKKIFANKTIPVDFFNALTHEFI